MLCLRVLRVLWGLLKRSCRTGEHCNKRNKGTSHSLLCWSENKHYLFVRMNAQLKYYSGVSGREHKKSEKTRTQRVRPYIVLSRQTLHGIQSNEKNSLILRPKLVYKKGKHGRLLFSCYCYFLFPSLSLSLALCISLLTLPSPHLKPVPSQLPIRQYPFQTKSPER